MDKFRLTSGEKLLKFVGLAEGVADYDAVNYVGHDLPQLVEDGEFVAVFTKLTLSQMAHVIAIRSERNSVFRIGLFSNKPPLTAVILTIVLQLSLIYTPLMQGFSEPVHCHFLISE